MVRATNAAFRQRKVQCSSPTGLHRMAYLEWGDQRNPRVLVCVHGLTRCARDFDVLARRLATHYRVVCPDLPGRGDSEWLKNPMEYQLPLYLSDVVTLLARLDVEEVDWVGTSLGGLVGMVLAGLPDTPVRRLVLNDVGPVLAAPSLARIGEYVGRWPPLPSIEAAETYVRTICATFGPHTDAEWRFLTENVVRENLDGSWRMHYDPALAIPFRAQPSGAGLDLWSFYDAVRCPTLVLRGEESDLLTAATAQAMAERGPRAQVAEVAGVGHAPTLIHDEQIAFVRGFLLER